MAAVARRQQRSEGLRAAVRIRPAGGAAAQAVLRMVAEAFGVPRRDVTLVTGATSRDKVIEVAGRSKQLARRLAELLGT